MQCLTFPYWRTNALRNHKSNLDKGIVGFFARRQFAAKKQKAITSDLKMVYSATAQYLAWMSHACEEMQSKLKIPPSNAYLSLWGRTIYWKFRRLGPSEKRVESWECNVSSLVRSRRWATSTLVAAR